MANVNLISYTPNALEVLLFTKQTRLKMSADSFSEVKKWSDEEKLKQLGYMLDTIQSSWEFVDYTFTIEGVTRAFTHQLVRHRVGTSFAQQSQRTVDMKGFDYLIPEGIRDLGEIAENEALVDYRAIMADIDNTYGDLLASGADPQDARGILPTNILTNIVFKANLRTLHEMGLKRLCVRTQGEFQDVFKLMRNKVIEVHPWAEKFIRVWCAFYGTCCFPRHPVDKCHVKPWVYNPQAIGPYGGNEYGLLTPDEINTKFMAGTSKPQTVVA